MVLAKKNKKQIFISILIIEVLILLFTIIPKLLREDLSINIPIYEGNPRVGHFADDGYHFDIEDKELVENYSPVFFNTFISVPKGSYSLIVNYRSDAGSRCGVTLNTDFIGDNSNPSVDEYVRDTTVECDDVILDHHINTRVSNVVVKKDCENVDFYIKYCGYQSFVIYDAVLVRNNKDISVFFVKWLAICMILNVILYLIIIKQITPFNNLLFADVCILTLFGIILSIPLFRDYIPLQSDFAGNYIRVDGIMNGIKDYQFPVKVHPTTLQDFGYAFAYFYPELFWSIPALLRLVGFSIMASFKFYVIFTNFVTLFLSYYAIRKVYDSRVTALFGSFVYAFSLFRIYDVYSSGAMGESFSMAFIPLVIAGMYTIFADEKDNQVLVSFKTPDWLPLSLGIVGIASLHVLSMEMLVFFIFVACVICCKKVFVKEHFLSLVKAAVSSFLLTIYFWIPFLVMLSTDSFKVFTNEPYKTTDSMLSILSMFTPFFYEGEEPGLGIGLAVGVCASIVFLVILLVKCLKAKTSVNTKLSSKMHLTIVCFALGVLAIIATTNIFPWEYLEANEGILKTIFCTVQFPSRYLSFASVFVVFSYCGVISCLLKADTCEAKPESKKINYVIAVLLMVASSVLTIMSDAVLVKSIYENRDKQYFYDSPGIMAYWGTGMGEFEPTDFKDLDVDCTIYELQPILDPEYYEKQIGGQALYIEAFEKRYTKSTVAVANPADYDQILYLPYIYYYGYTAENVFDNGDGLEATIVESSKGTLALSIPAGFHNGIHIEYKEPAVFRIFELISLLSVIFIVLYCKQYAIKNSDRI